MSSEMDEIQRRIGEIGRLVEASQQNLDSLEARFAELDKRVGVLENGVLDIVGSLKLDTTDGSAVPPKIYRIVCACGKQAVFVWPALGSPPTETLECPCGLIHQPPADEDK